MAGQLTYVYAVADADLARSAQLPELTGVDGAPVRTVVRGGLSAVVTTVEADRFDEDALRTSFEDLRWLDVIARAHNDVVDVLARERPLAPLRLATVYHHDDNVGALLDARAGDFAAVLDRIRGRTEWGVKGFAVPAPAPQPPAAPQGGGPGTSYLMRRRAERDWDERSEARAREDAERVHERLADIAVASRRYPPQDTRLTGYRDEMVLNAAYLMDEAEVTALQGAVRDGNSPVLRLDLTGPWAPYSFATLEEKP